MTGRPEALLSIAGVDPTAGAGLLLDAAVFRSFGFPAAGIVTAVTAQNTLGVRSFSCLGARSLKAQHDTLAGDVRLAGLKLGMIGCREHIAPLVRILGAHEPVPRVIDPVLRSSSGRWLIDPRTVPVLTAKFRDLFTVWTPNLDEAGRLCGTTVDSLGSMKEAALRLAVATRAAVIVKGGHLTGKAVNVLYDGSRVFLFSRPRLRREVHGTGCFFSAALLALLASGCSLDEAAGRATDATHRAIGGAVRLGNGRLVISPANPPRPERRTRRPVTADLR